MLNHLRIGFLVAGWMSPGFQVLGQWIPLQNATATFTQLYLDESELWNPERTIDGLTEGFHTSWAVNHDPPNSSEIIVWETQDDLEFSEATTLRFDIFHRDFIPRPGHNLGRFRISYTTDDRDHFADGLAADGAVTANWVVLVPERVVSTESESFTLLPDHSILVGGMLGDYPVYTIESDVRAAGITGFRLEAMLDESLPGEGPGRQPVNGNFHLSEFVVSVVGIKDRTVQPLSELTFTVSGADFGLPYALLTYDLGTDAPEGATISLEGIFRWTPLESQGSGAYPITIRASFGDFDPILFERIFVVTVSESAAAVKVRALAIRDGELQLTWPVQAGRRYWIQFKGSLSDPEWMDLTEPTESGEFNAPIAEDGQGFYRVQVVP